MNWQKFHATQDEYYSMLDFVMNAAEESEIPDKQQIYLELGFEEAVVNVINYAYPKTEGDVFITAYRDGEYFIVELKDSGVAFNPLMIESNVPTKAADLDDAKIGGHGISFMRRIFNRIEYIYEREGETCFNRLKMGMKISDGGDVSL